MVIELSTSVKSVGLTKNPLSKPVGTLVDALLNVAEHALPLPVRDDRPAQRARILWVAGQLAFVDPFQDLDALVVPGPGQKHPGGVGATLSGMHARRDAHHAGDREIGILEHDGRRLAAELEEQALHRGRALLHDALADDGGSGERDQVDLR
jgi:hypothetical protein